ncbi:hypothetical protein PFISCL1PPCAC_19985 [Pristionchus fissidentatus]|uniref:Bromo domain-containing protein n=1 Tax=Pristionchus fissidentatus TaxID=1538716 RepID=A0AAV5WDB4_9BILA|nr:hypothetical protein PFISCL1PPCAC_19985 [Pristionchus fissidentatus]
MQEVEEELEASEEDEVEEMDQVMKKASLHQYNGLQLLLDHLVRRLMEKDREEYFHFPVTPSIAPDYNNIIKNPMDLQTMREKIERNEYSTVPQLRDDGKLIAKNAMIYNAPHTVYHIAAQRLAQAVDHYTSDLYLRECCQLLPFSSLVDWNGVGLKSEEEKERETKKKMEEVEMTAHDILNNVNQKVREKLSARLPNAPKLAFVDNKNGCSVLNVIGEENDSAKPRLINLVGKVEEGTAGVFAPCDTKVIGRNPISYLNYGVFCSFAPHLDSTWATMKKSESDLLLRTYGDRKLASDALSASSFARNAPSIYVIMSGLLDKMTDGEHSWAEKSLNKCYVEGLPHEPISDMDSHLREVESLTNLGIDVSWVDEMRRRSGVNGNEISNKLEKSGIALRDLASVQRERLSAVPPVSLSRVPAPAKREMELARDTSTQLIEHMRMVEPGDMMSAATGHESMAMDLDMDILSEFFVP